MKFGNKKGFTLVELLVVIAVLGILAAVILVAINPLEQMARGRDAGRKTAVGQLANAVQAYYTIHGGLYPDASTQWLTDLQSAGEITQPPTNSAYTLGGTACANGSVQNEFCYITDVSRLQAVVYVTMESGAERYYNSACTGDAWFAWSSDNGKGGRVCGTEPGGVGALTFQD